MPPKRFLKSPPPTRTLLIRFQALPIARVSILFLNKRERGVSSVCRDFWVPNYVGIIPFFFRKVAARSFVFSKRTLLEKEKKSHLRNKIKEAMKKDIK
jgi:hypothetical protein